MRSILLFFTFILIAAASSCLVIKTDGVMSVDGRIEPMIYFDTYDSEMVIQALTREFGKPEYDLHSTYSWTNIVKPEWSEGPMKMQLLKIREEGRIREDISVVIIDAQGQTLTAKGSPAFRKIRKYFRQQAIKTWR